MNRLLLFCFIGIASFGVIAGTFWWQEWQYILPTPVPKGYQVIQPGRVIAFNQKLLPQKHEKPILLHFFSPSCPCSRFNLRHFKSLYRRFGKQVDFFAVTPETQSLEMAKKYLPESIPIIEDKDEALARACGVYSTPQAAIINTDNTLYFRGNYNRSRYCTNKATNYVEIALESLVSNRPLPDFDSLAVISYGCEIDWNDNPE